MNNDRNLSFYMANLGSEISRIFSYKEKGQKELMENCYIRVKDIFSKLSILPEAKSRKLELDILADVLNDFQKNTGKYEITEESLKNYFLPFAIRVLAK